MTSRNLAGGMPSPSDVDLALLQAQQRDRRLLADLEGDLVEIGHALAEVVRVALEARCAGRASIRST